MTRARRAWDRGAVFAAAAVAALGGSRAAAQVVVHQPSFGVTTANGSVIVPDGGSAPLGGVGRSASGSVASGLPFPGAGNRAFGRSSGAATMSVHATIIDFRTMEERLAAEAAGLPDGGTGAARPGRGEAPSFSEHLARIRAEAGSPREAREAVARAKLDRGIEKFEAGDPRLARLWLEAARREGDAEVRKRATVLLARIGTAPGRRWPK